VGAKRGQGRMSTAEASASGLCEPHDSRVDVDAASPMAKKKKLSHHGIRDPSFLVSKKGMSIAAREAGKRGGQEQDGRPRLPSPTDVRHPSMIAIATNAGSSSSSSSWGSRKIQVAPMTTAPSKQCTRIKTLPPTLRGIADAARVLRASKSIPCDQAALTTTTSKNNSSGHGAAAVPPLLLSFPTESVYMLSCCVKAASSRSILRKLRSRNDSSTSCSSSSSSKGSLDMMMDFQDPATTVHPPNASLEWMLNCNNDRSSASPLLFVLDGHHALNFCHFSKPKTFAIRPSSLNSGSAANSPTPGTPPASPRSNPEAASETKTVCPTSQANATANEAPLTPKPLASSSTIVGTPVTPNQQKLLAANFSESREAFLRLASKFWPGPVTIRVRARMLGEEEAPFVSHSSSEKMIASSSSVGSIPSLPSMGDLAFAEGAKPSGSGSGGGGSMGGVPVLPPSVLLPTKANGSYFIAMQCPSHPLPRKILSEIYRGPPVKARNGSNNLDVSNSVSCDSLASMDENSSGGESKVCSQQNNKALSFKNGRARSNIAVVGCMVPGPQFSANNSVNPTSSLPLSACSAGVTKAVDVDKAMSTMVHSNHSNQRDRDDGRIFVLNGEDNRESFSVPTCQYGKPHPVSLVIDGDNQTIHLIHRSVGGANAGKSNGAATKETLVTKRSVYRALLEPASQSTGQSFNLNNCGAYSQNSATEKRGDGTTSIDRVITAVLSRWKIQESATSAFD